MADLFSSLKLAIGVGRWLTDFSCRWEPVEAGTKFSSLSLLCRMLKINHTFSFIIIQFPPNYSFQLISYDRKLVHSVSPYQCWTVSIVLIFSFSTLTDLHFHCKYYGRVRVFGPTRDQVVHHFGQWHQNAEIKHLMLPKLFPSIRQNRRQKKDFNTSHKWVTPSDYSGDL